MLSFKLIQLCRPQSNLILGFDFDDDDDDDDDDDYDDDAKDDT